MADTQRDDLEADPGLSGASAAEASPPADGAEVTSPDPTGGAEAPGPAASAPSPVAAAAPVSASPAQEPAPAGSPTVESTTTVPPLASPAAGGPAGEGEGGEWNLLVEKVQQWWASGELQNLWRQAKSPLTIALAVVALLLVLRVYAGLLAAVNSLPLVPGLLELVGLIWAVRYGLPRLIRRSEREQLIAGLQRRWQSFSGRG
jgi:hypothetical protein